MWEPPHSRAGPNFMALLTAWFCKRIMKEKTNKFVCVQMHNKRLRAWSLSSDSKIWVRNSLFLKNNFRGSRFILSTALHCSLQSKFLCWQLFLVITNSVFNLFSSLPPSGFLYILTSCDSTLSTTSAHSTGRNPGTGIWARACPSLWALTFYPSSSVYDSLDVPTDHSSYSWCGLNLFIGEHFCSMPGLNFGGKIHKIIQLVGKNCDLRLRQTIHWNESWELKISRD